MEGPLRAAARAARAAARRRPAHDDVVLVLEGAAKKGVREGVDHHVRTVHARRDGDSAIVAVTNQAIGDGEQVTVITADRVLRGAVENLGARAMTPCWLLDHL